MPLHRSALSNRSDSSDLDLDGIAESELAKLQRQFRLLEGDRRAYAQESQETIRRQLAEIHRLEKEQEGLLKELQLAESRANQLRERAQAGSLRAMLQHKDQTQEQVAQERRTLACLDLEIQSWEKRLAELQRHAGSAGITERDKAQIQKKVQTLENQLNRTLAKFNSQLVLNAHLREELETMRIEHSRFQQLCRRLEREAHEKRKEIGAVIDTSSMAYDARDEAQAKLGQLREKAEKDVAQHGAEMKELQRVLDHDRRLRQFLAIKAQERSLTQEALEARQRRAQELAEGKRRDPEEELLESYEDAFRQLRELKGEDDLDLLVEKFLEEEDQNFAEFNYINEQNSELEWLGEHIAQLQQEIVAAQAQEEWAEQEHQAELRAVETKQEAAVQEAEHLLAKEKEIIKTLEHVKAGIRELFEELGCDRTGLDEVLGGGIVVRDSTLLLFLGRIEQRATELLAMRSYLASKNFDDPYDPSETARLLLGQTEGVPTLPRPPQPPTAREDHDTEEALTDGSEEEERPLTHSELRERILQEVLSREETLPSKRSLDPEQAAGCALHPMEA
ncbi:outer dynein arm-docking complex subunit 1 isoform X2 [Alligator mississippiensis]|nr:outer dynein arm-docking complex subunit 1 isoform X2 [Alligator mississippiensis]XP_019344355.1 outer dynein arm-docking complex subunit 1 isoform X2 [Alligator mississippiensis]XP_059584079.1 outer dynein arm-docking complex subunit 1 isoform X2 [Alligator mississippiensis]